MSGYRFDAYLDQVRSDQLKSMARTYGGSSQMRKDQCIATIRRALDDPNRLSGIVATLSPFERNALAFAKQLGGAVDAEALAIALRASGVALPFAHSPYRDQNSDLIRKLIQHGVLLTTHSYDPGTLSSYGGSLVFSDPRLLAHAGAPEIKPMTLRSAAQPSSSTYRRPPTVVLDLISILQAIHAMGGLQLTQAGTIRVSDARKLVRALDWDATQMKVDGLAFPDPSAAFASALYRSGLLSSKDSALVVNVSLDTFATRPYADQVGALWHGFVSAREWREIELPGWYDAKGGYLVQGRWALSVALAALPVDGDGFCAMDDLSQALFERIGEYFSLDYPPSRPYHFNETPVQIRQSEDKWRAKLRADWSKEETPWLRQALATWLYYLGLVELGMENGTPISVRLTDLGRALLHPELKSALTQPARAASAWVVQPNFDVIVYLDRATPKQLAFLERNAERVNAQQHTAQYRLTRDAVYRGLESNTTLEELLSGLQTGAGNPLPPNVVTEIREWSALREKLTLRRRARLLEFSDASARDEAFNAGVTGTPVGDRFLLLDAAKVDARWTVETVDYAKPLERCLAVTEKGVIRLKEPARDLLLQAQLAHWTEPRPDGKWQLTARSIATALRAGARFYDLLTWLRERLTHTLPPLLEIALRAWAGESLQAELATVTVLRCPQPEVFAAIAKSQALKPYLRGQLAPDALLVDLSQIAALREQLAWMGLRMSDELRIETQSQ